MLHNRKSVLFSSLLVAVIVAAAPFIHAESPAPDDLQTIRVADGLYMLSGRGGNIGVSSGSDGVLLIDDQYAPQAPAIRQALAAISAAPVRFVINTHWHQDHTGGNENLAAGGAVIVAHRNVRKRLGTGQFLDIFNVRIPPSPEAALPLITFTRDLTFHFNGEEISVQHIARAHTDGDAVISFRGANVIHTGDIYFAGMYPFIDVSAGGSIDGVIAAVNSLLSVIDESTKIIPGHGPLTGKKDLRLYRDMLVSVRDSVAGLVARGQSLQEVIAARPTGEFDRIWGRGVLTPDQFVEIVFRSITAP